MASTYTTNLGLEKPATGEQAGSWGTTVGTDLDLIDEAINGIVSITLASAGTSGAPNDLPITDATSSNGRNAFITITDGGDLGAGVYVQLTPNDAEKIVWIKNSLTGSRDLYLFQGTYDAARDFVIAAGTTALVKFSGGGAGSSTVTEVMSGLSIQGTLTVGTLVNSGLPAAWTVQNSSTTVAVGGRYKCDDHAGIVLTMPGTFTTASFPIEVINVDTAQDVTLTPATGDAFFVDGVTLGTDVTYALTPGSAALILPKTASSQWDLTLQPTNIVSTVLTPSPTTDHTVSGLTASMTVGENVAFGQVLFMHTDGKLWLADANTVVERVFAMAAATILADAAGKVLKIGFVRDDTWAWTVGSPIYASETNGAMTQTVPTTSGVRVQVVGVATHADRMWFEPSSMWIVV